MSERVSLSEFLRDARKVVDEIRSRSVKAATLVYHDDGDGLCSAAIVKAALEHEGYAVKTLCLEKAYDEVVKSLHEGVNEIIFYADLGSSHADLISRYNAGRNLTVILDHHDPKPTKDPKVVDLNLEHYGFSGESDFSGSTCCYLFAKALDERNSCLAYLALAGSCEIPNGFRGLNDAVLKEALKEGVVRPKGKSFEAMKLRARVDDLFSKLQILGAVGYYEGGPELGAKACLNGLTEEVKAKVEELEERRKEANRRLLERLYQEGLEEGKHVQSFDAGDVFKGMGTKVLGQFCSFLSYQRRLVNPNKYVLGFVNVPPNVPSWGKLKGALAKASVRAPDPLRLKIDKGELPGAVQLLYLASEGFGLVDGHRYAASATFSADKKAELVKNVERVASSWPLRLSL